MSNASFVFAIITLCISIAWPPSVAIAEDPSAKSETTGITIGDSMPVFKLPGVDGKSYASSDFDDSKMMLVIFTCNHCPTAQAYEARIKKLHQDYSDRGLALVAITPNHPAAVRLDELGYSDLGDSFEDTQKRAQEAGFEFPYLYDGDTQTVAKAFGAIATPHAFLFDHDRKLRYAGRIDNGEVTPVTKDDLRNAIESLINGTTIESPLTRVFGCSLKWAYKTEDAVNAVKEWNQEPVTLTKLDEAGLKELVRNDTDKYRLINLWATWCGPCIEELPDFVEIHRMYRRRPFEMVTISLDQFADFDVAHERLKEAHASMTNYFSVVHDRDEFAELFDAKWPGPVPYTILIAPGGEIVYRHEDTIDALQVRREIVNRIGRTYAEK
ncbi:redoxin domain-containing protein [Rubripirellula amarantea]|nr:redoxin domain-containing protein [Rubripirellula amarantea]